MADGVVEWVTCYYLEAVICRDVVNCVVTDPVLTELVVKCGCESAPPLLLHYAK